MPGWVDFKIEGAREAERLLEQLGPEVASKIGSRAVRAGINVLAEEARLLVPIRTGALAESIGVNVPRNPEDEFTREANLVIRPPIWNRLWHVIEWGTIKMAAKPFIRPAVDGKASEALRETARVLARGVSREAKRLAKAPRR